MGIPEMVLAFVLGGIVWEIIRFLFTKDGISDYTKDVLFREACLFYFDSEDPVNDYEVLESLVSNYGRADSQMMFITEVECYEQYDYWKAGDLLDDIMLLHEYFIKIYTREFERG